MSDERHARPSPRAVQRFASDVGGEVADLRASLRQALEEADRHEAAGRHDRAAAVLTEQQELLAVVHRRLEGRLAEAAVEREAEGVLHAAEPVAPARAAHPAEPGATAQTAASPSGMDGDGMVLRLLASAAAAAIGVMLLVAPDGGGLTMAGWDSAGNGAADAERPAGTAEADVVTSTPARPDQAPVDTRSARPPADLRIPEAPDVRDAASGGSAHGTPGPDDTRGWLVPEPAGSNVVGEVVDEIEEAADTAGLEADLGDVEEVDGPAATDEERTDEGR